MSVKPFIDSYPILFRGKEPSVCTTVPVGWYPLVHEFCQLILKGCTPVEIDHFQFEEISADQGFLLMRCHLPPTLASHWSQAIEARNFAIVTRSHATCVNCGRRISKLPDAGLPPFCEECPS